MTITELGCMGVKPGLRITDPTTHEGTVLPSVWKKVLTKPGGPQRVFWGLEEEESSRVWAVFDWESVQQHEDFAQTHGAEAVKDIPKVCTHGVFTKHIKVLPSTEVLGSPAMRIILAYFPSDVTGVNMDARSRQVKHVLENTGDDSSRSVACSYGWGLVNDFPVLGDEGKSGSVLMIFIGEQYGGQHDSFFKGLVDVVKHMEGIIGFHQFTLCTMKQERK